MNYSKHIILTVAASFGLTLSACAQPPAAAPTQSPSNPIVEPTKPAAPAEPIVESTKPAAPTQPVVEPTKAPEKVEAKANLNGIKDYLVSQTAKLKTATSALNATSDQYFELASKNKFDYAAMFKSDKDAAIKLVQTAREQWTIASPLYEQMEGIVAGVPSLAQFDVNLDAGASKAEGGDGVVEFDIKLPDGRVLEKPGNLFGVSESALWGTFDEFKAKGDFDFNADGKVEFGESLPDANVLKGTVDLLNDYASQLDSAAQAWTPTESDAFQSLVTMIPTMSEYFESWKSSRFVSGDASTQRDFVAISRLADIQDILSSLQVVHQNVSPLIASKNAGEDTAIGKGLGDLKSFVADVYAKEKAGKKFSAEEADLLGKEAQDRATAVTGKVAQVAAQLGIKVTE
jgi:hypothetical protein